MNSSISHSKGISPSSAKKRLLALLLMLLAALVSSTLFTRYLNFELAYFSRAKKVSDQWSQMLDTRFASKYVMYGASSTRMSIDPGILLNDYNIPLVNAGLTASLGAPVLTELALEYAKPGDTLIIALEPMYLAVSENEGKNLDKIPSTLSGDRFLFNQKGFPYHGVIYSLDYSNLSRLFLGSARYNWILLGKIITRTPLYRYDIYAVIHENGWVEVDEKRAMPVLPKNQNFTFHEKELSTAGEEFLSKIKAWANQRGVKLVYSLPRKYTHANFRYVMANYVLAISKHMPVLKDPCLGAYPVSTEYSDTINHLNAVGTKRLTHELAREILENDFWTEHELMQIIEEGKRSPDIIDIP